MRMRLPSCFPWTSELAGARSLLRRRSRSSSWHALGRCGASPCRLSADGGSGCHKKNLVISLILVGCSAARPGRLLSTPRARGVSLNCKSSSQPVYRTTCARH